LEIKKKSVIPVYGLAIVWLLYCLVFPIYKTWHFIALACVAVLSYVILSAIFPVKTEHIEIPDEPERTGNEEIDALLAEGEVAVAEMRRLFDTIPGEHLKKKIESIIAVTDKIFKDLLEDPDDYKLVRRFADFYLPTTIKLLHAYDRFDRSGIDGDNITGTLERIETALDRILSSYENFFDSLFENQALDIETDIIVLENMLKQESLLK